jgi:glycine cleavage system regulatory protein
MPEPLTTLVFTLIGHDRPGIVEAVAAPVAAHGGNWLESRMAHLAGQFAGIVRVDVPASRAGSLIQSLESLKAKGLQLVFHSGPRTDSATTLQMARLEVIGHDRPGIVSQISRALAARGVNMEEFASEIRSAPMSGEMLFHATALLSLPAGANMESLRREVEEIAGALMVDVTLE